MRSDTTDEASPERTALGDLTRLAKVGVKSAQSLEECLGLERLFLAALGRDDCLSPESRRPVLMELLHRVANDARWRSLRRLEEDPFVKQQKESDFQVAAVAELLGATDEAAFNEKNEKWKRDNAGWTWAQELEYPDNKSPRRRRQLRAGVWLEQSRSSVERKEKRLLIVFESALKTYIATHREELKSSVADHLEPAENTVASGHTPLVPGTSSAEPAGSTVSSQSTPSPPPGMSAKLPRVVRRWTIVVATASIVTLSVIATVSLWNVFGEQEKPSAEARSKTRPVPAPSSSPPVSIDSVSTLRGNRGRGDFVLKDGISMPPQELKKLNETFASTESFDAWYGDQAAVAVAEGTITVTVRGNSDDVVQITDLKAVKDCEPPLSGTYFQHYTQGSGDVLPIGIDLDSPESVAKEMARTSADGWHATKDDYFAVNTLTLRSNETETISVAVSSDRYSCTFTLRMTVATPHGSYWQEIDADGKPFRLTAAAPYKDERHPFSGYRSLYVEDQNGWRHVDPVKYE